MLKEIGLIVGGAVIGGAATYFIMKKKNDELVEKYEDHISRLKESYQDEIDRMVETKHKKVLAEQNDILKSNLNFGTDKEEVTYEITGTDEEEECFTDKSLEINPIPGKPVKRNYMDEKYTSKKAMMDKYEADMEEEEFDESEEEDDEDFEAYIPTYPKEGPSEEPYGISPEMFLGDNHLDKVTLIWWEDDGILVTEDDVDVTNNINETVGYSFDDFFDLYNFDEAYIRNDMNGTDYQVIRKFGSYIMDKEL